MSAGSRAPRPRGLFIAALLLLTLALAGAIALQAYRNFLGHKATAERVLHDYARLAAARFANRTEMNFYYENFSPAMDALMRAKAGVPDVPLPAPSHLPATTEPHAADFRKLAHYTFRYDLRSGHMETAGTVPPPAVRKWLRDTLPAHRRTVYDPKEHLGAIVRTVDGASRAIIYTVVNDNTGAPRTIVGLEEDARGLEPLYTADEDRAPLLPRPLTGGVAYDSLGSVIVTEADGRELYRSPTQYAPTFSARDSFEHPMMGAMRVQVALRPDLAPKLVIGGMPRSNLPMLLSLLALTAGLVVAALLQLRREYELSRLRADFVSGVSHERRAQLVRDAGHEIGAQPGELVLATQLQQGGYNEARGQGEQGEQHRQVGARHTADDELRREVGPERHLHPHGAHHRVLERVPCRKRGRILSRRAIQLPAVRLRDDH